MGQRLQYVTPRAVDGRRTEHQTVAGGHMDGLAPEHGAAGLFQSLRHILRRQFPGAGRFGNGACHRHGVGAVAGGQGKGLACAEVGPQGDGDSLVLAVFI